MFLPERIGVCYIETLRIIDVYLLAFLAFRFMPKTFFLLAFGAISSQRGRFDRFMTS